MSIFRRGGRRKSSTQGVTGPARIARGGSGVTSGLRTGDVAIIDRSLLTSADTAELVKLGVAAVVNVSPSGEWGATGIDLLTEAGIPLVDQVGEGVVTRLRSGDRVRVFDGKIFRDDVLVASGIARDAESAVGEVPVNTDLTTRLQTLAVNAADHLRQEHAVLLDGARVPRVRTRIKGRPVVVVSDSFDAVADLKRLKRFIFDRDPVLIGAGKGGELIVAAGYIPDLLVGDIEVFSSAVIQRAREVVVTTASGQIRNPERLEKHQRDVQRFIFDGDDVDLAILLADVNEAGIIVHAGAAPSMPDFLGQHPGLVGPAFVVRLRAASKLVDAKVVGQMTSGRISAWPIIFLLLCAGAALAVAISLTPAGGDVAGWIADGVRVAVTWIKGLWS
ncbi:MAG: putative cytokinetic ring protein SteA [Aeromicrobium sp.]|uniref:putative cytokinetic ring protein SteA n=1 Tax=Aeromicrobium sp. TaxID=1871063 RepID=UPI0039E2DD22